MSLVDVAIAKLFVTNKDNVLAEATMNPAIILNPEIKIYLLFNQIASIM
jgi:hypothetical protein